MEEKNRKLKKINFMGAKMKSNKIIKNKIIKILTIVSISLLFLFTTGFTKLPETKNETVYVSLNNDGSVREVKTVNWLNIAGLSDNEGSYIDYGEYDAIKSMINEAAPETEGNKIIWNADSFESGNLFYQGTTSKEIPVKIDIKYYLDGKDMPGKDIAGKSGSLKIEINVENKLKNKENIFYKDYLGNNRISKEDCYTPLMVQLSIKADVTKFTDIQAEGATKMLTGKIMNISFADFPFPESDFTLQMEGKDIQLEPINIVVIPSEIPAITDLEDSKKNLEEFDSGLAEMSDGSKEIIEGSEKLGDGLTKLKDGSSDLVNAISEINHGLYVLSESNDDMSSGFQEIGNGLNEFTRNGSEVINAVQQLTSNLEGIKNGLDQSAAGASRLSQGADDMAVAIEQLRNINTNLMAIVQGLVNSDPTNLAYQQLYGLATTEGTLINGVNTGAQRASAGMRDLSTGIGLLSAGVNDYKGGMEQFSSNLILMIQSFELLAGGQSRLFSAWEQYGGAVGELFEGTNKLYAEISSMPEDVGKLADGSSKIKEGIQKLKEEGIDEIKSQVIENIDKVNEGIVIEKEINKLSDDYNSFMDTGNTNSQVQFIMQTDAIKTEKIAVSDKQEEIEKETFWQRFLNLFRK
jgi:putative membrane protein